MDNVQYLKCLKIRFRKNMKISFAQILLNFIGFYIFSYPYTENLNFVEKIAFTNDLLEEKFCQHYTNLFVYNSNLVHDRIIN